MKSDRFPNVTGYQDRHGKWRWRYRKTGAPTHTFRADYGTAAFAEEYEVAAGRPPYRGSAPALSSLRGVPLVYFVAAKGGPVKIGSTTNIASRITRLQTAVPKPLELLALIPGGADTEAALHEQFKDACLKGEWFRRTPELNALIRANRHGWWRTYGAPSVANPQNV
jgi:hypothetical protein